MLQVFGDSSNWNVREFKNVSAPLVEFEVVKRGGRNLLMLVNLRARLPILYYYSQEGETTLSCGATGFKLFLC